VFAAQARPAHTVRHRIGGVFYENQKLSSPDDSTGCLDRRVRGNQSSLFQSRRQPRADIRPAPPAGLKGAVVTVRADIEFLAPDIERPFTYAREAPPGAEPETARFVRQAVEIRDLRGGGPLRLEEHGGTLGRWPSRVRRFDDDAE